MFNLRDRVVDDMGIGGSWETLTLVELLKIRSTQSIHQSAYTYLDGDLIVNSWTYQQLNCRSCAIAAHLQSLHLVGERALLLYPPGLEFIAAFLGCLYAGVIAVPAYPPRNQRNTPRILAIAQDADAAIALTTSTVFPQIQPLLSSKSSDRDLRWLVTDDLDLLPGETWQTLAEIDSNSIAMLQYTSGSTGTPKGVMLSHRNLMHNAAVTYQVMAHSAESRFISWLPMYHDMGLIGGILQPLYGGFPCTLMAPATFLQSPYRWLKAISDYRGTTSGAPNFAYELCVQKVTSDQLETLDLSSWTVAFNGAEPIRSQTLERFAEKFAPCGFRAEAFYPCYGMAEATLMVTGGEQHMLPFTKTIAKAELEVNEVVEVGTEDRCDRPDARAVLVSCGQTMPGQQVIVVRPEARQPCPPQEVGEVWVTGPSVGQGYWQRPDESAETFRATLANGEGAFLRTGDLGFLQDGELFITGRLKDLIIIRGRNLYPQDIERTVEQSHPSLRLGSGAAFAIASDRTERLVVVQELDFRQKPDPEVVIAAIRQAVSEHHEVQVYGVVLLKPGSIPKTSSGKIQRRACRAAFLQGELQAIAQNLLILTEDEVYESTLNRESLLALAPELRQGSLLAELQNRVARVLALPPEAIEPQSALTHLGLDSLKAFDLKSWIERDFGIALCIVDLFDRLSLDQLSQNILARVLAAPTTPWIQPHIPTVDRTDRLPLGLAQERLWFLSQLEPDSPFYNVAIALHLRGSLDRVILEQSLQALIQRHETLRTYFAESEGQLVQVIHPDASLVIQLNPVETHSPSEIQAFILKETQQPFDLGQAPLLRANLLRASAQDHLLLLTFHHIISDGWSIGVFIQELAALYNAFSQGQPSPLAELPLQYVDFVAWQRQWLQTQAYQTQLSYWQQQLSGHLPVLQLQFDRPRPTIQTYAGKKHPLVFSKAIAESLKALSQTAGTTLYMTLLAAFYALLYCDTPQDDILIGSPIAGRSQPQTAGLIGFFISTLVLRTSLSGNPSFLDLLARVRAVALGGYAHQDVPFERLVEALQPQRSLSYNPLFQVMFIFQNTAIPTVELPDLTFTPEEVDGGTSKFDLKLSLWETAEGLAGSLEYKTDLFDSATIATMADRLEQLLYQVTAQPTVKLDELTLQLARGDRLPPADRAIAHQQKLKIAKRKAISAV
ncbi:condensation domain-containing protein [Altericista sp. CCNU0014]|uniref:condensation domain-containing protein n=1 Tax=Altericista sp. CCNU0014 TaxID=3082949 RepID=UPI0038502805